MSSPTISVHVSVTVAPENAQKFLELFRSIYETVSAEPECVFFEVYQNPATPGEFKFVENWNGTQEWFREVQMQKEYYKPYVAVTEPLWIKPREIEIWERMPGNAWVTVKKGLTEKV
ncbi:hypothetical protein BKA66DRAFT_438668 [Pyrenochaeta sp. MPI-SDFR-AT-0127]|nr:hypothetical protein BKA66DRAFT_438668 [Pyrenochaeta sp. MPI-SDFR-AT-0127]